MGATAISADVLVIDDEPAILDVVRACLSDEGYRVATAATLACALDRLTRDRCAVILTDSFSTPPDPWDGLDRLRAAARDTPVVICSAHRADVFDGWRERGFAGLIAKPFDLDDLLAGVRAHLGAA